MKCDFLSNMVIHRVHTVATFFTKENARGRRTDRHTWAMVLKYEGETVYSHGKETYLSDAAHVVFLPRGSSYEWHCTRAGNFFTVEFECPLTGEAPVSVGVKNGEKILKKLKELEEKRTLKSPTAELESLKDMYSILLLLAKNDQEQYVPNQKQSLIAPALAYMSKHYDRHITNDTLAALTGLSTVYFRKLFTQLMGQSPIAYLRELRIGRAKEMLRSDYGTLSHLAQSLGYGSLYDFSRDFKKHTGVSPSRYGKG